MLLRLVNSHFSQRIFDRIFYFIRVLTRQAFNSSPMSDDFCKKKLMAENKKLFVCQSKGLFHRKTFLAEKCTKVQLSKKKNILSNILFHSTISHFPKNMKMLTDEVETHSYNTNSAIRAGTI